MKRLLLFFTILFSFKSFAHNAPLAFAEMEIKNKKIELTLTLDTHEIIEYLEKGNYNLIDFEEHRNNEQIKVYLTRFLLSGFKIWENETFVNLNLIDYDIKQNGNIEFYFSSANEIRSNQLKIRFDLLMNEHENQQNKLIFIEKSFQKSYTFNTSLTEVKLD